MLRIVLIYDVKNEAIEQIIALMEQQPNNCEFFFECTMLGCEEIYKRLYQRFKKKVPNDMSWPYLAIFNNIYKDSFGPRKIR